MKSLFINRLQVAHERNELRLTLILFEKLNFYCAFHTDFNNSVHIQKCFILIDTGCNEIFGSFQQWIHKMSFLFHL